MKHFVALFCIFLSDIIFSQASFSGDILFHEEIFENDTQETVMYRVKEDGSGLKNFGNGGFPQQSSDNTYLSYIKTVNEDFGFGVYGDLVVKDMKSDELLPVQNFTKVDCRVVRCPPQPAKVDTLAMRHCTIQHRWSPDSRRIAYATALGLSLRDGFVYVFDAKTQQTTRLHHFTYYRFSGVAGAISLSWSPDGKFLLFNTSSMGPMKKDAPEIYLIDPETQAARVIETGYLPRFADNKRIIFSTGQSLWIKNIESGEKKKLADIKLKVSALSEVMQNRVLIQTAPEKNPFMGTLNLYLLNLDDQKMDTINLENYDFYCPEFSPDGQKMTVFGVNRGQKVMGYYVYDFQSRQAVLLKALKVERNRGFRMEIIFGYGNHTYWN